MTHNLKTIQPYYDDIKTGKKNFEIRFLDRNYQVGDTLHLEEYIHVKNKLVSGCYTGKFIRKKVTYILKDCPQFGLQEGYCILGLADIEKDINCISANQSYKEFNVPDSIQKELSENTDAQYHNILEIFSIYPETWERKINDLYERLETETLYSEYWKEQALKSYNIISELKRKYENAIKKLKGSEKQCQ